jgi:SAM-dependent methyltransferase
MSKTTLWDQRYDTDEFVYGREPNAFFAASLDKLSPGKILLPGEGEGRNAIYAGEKGWKVDAFDSSRIGIKKASAFALEKNLEINFQVCDVAAFTFKKDNYDSVGLIYFHVPLLLRKLAHQKVAESLKPGGILILEGFHTSQLGRKSGGPQSLEMLFDQDILLEDFNILKTELLEVTEVNLNEGLFHGGAAKLIRYRGIKK